MAPTSEDIQRWRDRPWETAICEAISKKIVLQFTYGGYLRIVEPQCHGMSTAGNEVLRGIQTGGESRSGLTRFGKFFEVSKISGLRMTGSNFSGPGPGYNPDDQGMIYIHCHL